MKKVFKNPIIMFILGALIFGGVGTIFAYSLIASNVGFTPKDSSWEVDNVENAINDLYKKTMPDVELVYSYFPDSYYDGTLTKTVNLKTGIYLLVVSRANSEGFNSTTSVTVTNATILKNTLDYQKFVGETNINLYNSLLKVEGTKDVTISISQSIARGYSLKVINIYKIK